MLTLALLDRMFHLLDGLYPAGTAPHTNMLLYAAMALAIVATSLQRPLRHTSRAESLLWAGVVLVCLTGLVLPGPTGAGAGGGGGRVVEAALARFEADQP